MKKILSILLAATMVLSCGVVAFAEEVKDGTTDVVQGDIMLISEDEIAEPVETEEVKDGTTEEVQGDVMLIAEENVTPVYNKSVVDGSVVKVEDTQITVKTENDEIIINVDDNTVFVKEDSSNISLTDIKEKSVLRVVASNAVTMSIPAQVYGYVVMVAEPETIEPAFPFYFEVEEVVVGEEGTEITSADGMYKLVLGEDTVVTPFRTKNIVTVSDIKYGTELLVTAPTATMSIPSVLSATNIVMLEAKTVTNTESVYVNDEEVEMTVVVDGVVKVPVRFVAEKLGYEVGWDGNLSQVTVGTVPMGVNFVIGENAYNKSRMTPFELSAAPELIESRTYVPVDFFTEVLGAKVKVVDGTLSFIN